MKRLLIVLLTFILLFSVAGCTGGEVKKIEDQDPATVEEIEKQKQKEEQPKQDTMEIAKIGETLEIEGVRITITNVNRFEGKINEYEPLENDHAIVIDLVVENTTNEIVSVDELEFTLYDSKGFEVKHALPSDEMAIMDEISGGKKIKGKLFFDVPKKEGNFELIYKPFITDTEAKFEIPYK